MQKKKQKPKSKPRPKPTPTPTPSHTKPKEQSLTVCRPLLVNVPKPPKGWTPVLCRFCGEPCWKMDIEPDPLPRHIIAACTDCGLRRGQHQRKMDFQLARKEGDMRALVLGDDVKAVIKSKRDFADAPENWYRPAQGDPCPGDNPKYVTNLQVGFKVVYTMTVFAGVRFRQITISVDGDKYPSPQAAFTIAHLFGFTGAKEVLEDCVVDPAPDWQMDIRYEDRCIEIREKVADAEADV